MSFECLIFKSGQEPFIYNVKYFTGFFVMEIRKNGPYEILKISEIELIEESSGRRALFIFSNKTGLDRKTIIEQIIIHKPIPVRYFK
jgi:hypothetical protein